MRVVPGVVGMTLLTACMRAPVSREVAKPCEGARPSASAAAGSASTLPAAEVVFMQDSGRLHVFALPNGSAPVHQFIRGLPAQFALGDEASAPTRITVLEPLRFDAITLFPAYYLTREVESASPRVILAAGTPLHRVVRLDTGPCGAYVGFDADEERRRFDFDGGEILGQYAPDLEVGPLEVPCDALGGASKDGASLASSAAPSTSAGPPVPLRLTPLRDADGWEHYEETQLELFAEPDGSSAVSIQGNVEGSELLAESSVTLLAERPGWDQIRLVIGGTVELVGWVAATAFERDDGSSLSYSGHGSLGGSHRTRRAPTYCVGTLAAGTRIYSGAGVAWATVASRVDGAFARANGHVYLVNFVGAYRDAFCSPGGHGKDTQGIASCLEDAEVRPEDVALRCPAPQP